MTQELSLYTRFIPPGSICKGIWWELQRMLLAAAGVDFRPNTELAIFGCECFLSLIFDNVFIRKSASIFISWFLNGKKQSGAVFWKFNEIILDSLSLYEFSTCMRVDGLNDMIYCRQPGVRHKPVVKVKVENYSKTKVKLWSMEAFSCRNGIFYVGAGLEVRWLNRFEKSVKVLRPENPCKAKWSKNSDTSKKFSKVLVLFWNILSILKRFEKTTYLFKFLYSSITSIF